MGSMRGLCHTSLCQSLNNLKPGITLKQCDTLHHIVRIADVSLVRLVKESVYGLLYHVDETSNLNSVRLERVAQCQMEKKEVSDRGHINYCNYRIISMFRLDDSDMLMRRQASV